MLRTAPSHTQMNTHTHTSTHEHTRAHTSTHTRARTHSHAHTPGSAGGEGPLRCVWSRSSSVIVRTLVRIALLTARRMLSASAQGGDGKGGGW
eukprot:825282-Prorocentrum_minimum.AAC.1